MKDKNPIFMERNFYKLPTVKNTYIGFPFANVVVIAVKMGSKWEFFTGISFYDRSSPYNYAVGFKGAFKRALDSLVNSINAKYGEMRPTVEKEFKKILWEGFLTVLGEYGSN